MKVYIVMRGTVDGRGPMTREFVFLHREDAENHVGGVDGDRKIEEVQVLEASVFETQRRHIELVASATAKLTPEEREALGL